MALLAERVYVYLPFYPLLFAAIERGASTSTPVSQMFFYDDVLTANLCSLNSNSGRVQRSVCTA
jgi:hypothetical protein